MQPFKALATLCVAACCSLFFMACKVRQQNNSAQPKGAALTTVLDYAQMSLWAAHPYKWDPADSVPEPLRASYRLDSTVDVFFLHPTTYTDKGFPLGPNGPIDNAALNEKTDNSTILKQASIFNAAGRVFAPRYRQANYFQYLPTTPEERAAAKQAFELAYADIKNAFAHYLKTWNQGRPIILAAHSQGSTHGQRLLREFFDSTLLRNRLVVAYLVGMPINPEQYQHLKPCTNPQQTGCITSWRTYREGTYPLSVRLEQGPIIVTNPLTWDNQAPKASRDQNEGGILLNFNQVLPRVTGAAVEGRVIWSERPHFFGSAFYTDSNYHVADMNLFYLSIRKDAQRRRDLFWKK